VIKIITYHKHVHVWAFQRIIQLNIEQFFLNSPKSGHWDRPKLSITSKINNCLSVTCNLFLTPLLTIQSFHYHIIDWFSKNMPADLNPFIHVSWIFFSAYLIAAACKAYPAWNVENFSLHVSFIYLFSLLLIDRYPSPSFFQLVLSLAQVTLVCILVQTVTQRWHRSISFL